MKNDLISRQAAIDALDEIRHALREIDIPSPTVPEYIEHHEQIQSVWKLLDKKQKELYVMPSAQPYTDEEIQKMQDIEQAQLDKAYEIGKADAMAEIIRCRECRHYTFADNRAFGFPAKRCEWTGFEDVDDDDFCSRAERREDNK